MDSVAAARVNPDAVDICESDAGRVKYRRPYYSRQYLGHLNVVTQGALPDYVGE